MKTDNIQMKFEYWCKSLADKYGTKNLIAGALCSLAFGGFMPMIPKGEYYIFKKVETW